MNVDLISPASDLPEVESILLLRLASGWWPPYPFFGNSATVHFGDMSLVTDSLIVNVLRGTLALHFSVPLSLDSSRIAWSGGLRVDFDDGSSVTAASAHRTSMRVRRFFEAGPDSTTVTIEALKWRWSAARDLEPVLWVSRVDIGVAGVGLGSASFEAVMSLRGDRQETLNHSSWQTRLSGTAQSYIIEAKTSEAAAMRAVALLAPADTDKWMVNDWLALQVAIGRRVEIEELIGVSAEGRVVAIDGRRVSGTDMRGAQRAGIPVNSVDSAVESFVSSLCPKTGILPALRKPVSLYLDALGDSVDGTYLKLRAAILFLTRVKLGVDATGGLLLLRKWDSIDGRPRGLMTLSACDADAALAWLALNDYNSDAAQWAIEALAGEVSAALDYAVFGEAQRRALELARRVYYVLLSAIVGYDGPILAPGTGEVLRGVSPTERPAQIVHVRAALEYDSILAAWPAFQVPRPPDRWPFDVVARFAASLSSRTGGVVRAFLQPAVGDDEAQVQCDFKIVLTASPTVQATVFTLLEAAAGAVSVEGWPESDQDAPMLVESPSALTSFLAHVAHSKTMRALIHRYMLLGFEFSRGER